MGSGPEVTVVGDDLTSADSKIHPKEQKRSWTDRFAAICALLTILIVRFFSFFFVLATADYISVFIRLIYAFILGAVLPPEIQCGITILIMVFMFKNYKYPKKGSWVTPYCKMYPKSLRGIPRIIGIILYILNLAILYGSFEKSHLLRSEAKDVPCRSQIPFFEDEKTSDTKNGFPVKDPQCNSGAGLFVFYLFINFYFALNFLDLDLVGQLSHIPCKDYRYCCMNILAILGFMGIHIAMNIVYALPLFFVAYSDHHNDIHGGVAFFRQIAAGIALGILAGLFETGGPWPRVRSLRPFYLYEINTAAKTCLSIMLTFSVIKFYYQQFATGELASTGQLTAGNTTFLYFTLSVAFMLIHLNKTWVFACLLNRKERVKESTSETKEMEMHYILKKKSGKVVGHMNITIPPIRVNCSYV